MSLSSPRRPSIAAECIAGCGILAYLGMLIIFLAIGIYSRNWIGLFIVLIPTTLALLYRIHVEEAALNSAFGEAYASYSKTTRRLLPFIY